MQTIVAESALELVSQREFPEAESILVALVLHAVEQRRADAIVITVEIDGFTIVDNGRVANSEEIKQMWKLLCGVCAVEVTSWDIATQRSIHLANGWVRTATESEIRHHADYEEGTILTISRIFERLPVRRQANKGTGIFEGQKRTDIQYELDNIALLYPSVSLQCTFHSPYGKPEHYAHARCTTIKEVFSRIVGKNMTEGAHEFNMTRVEGLISSKLGGLHHSKALQIVLTRGLVASDYAQEIAEAVNREFRQVCGRAFLQLTNIHNRMFHLVYVIVVKDPRAWTTQHIEALAKDLVSQGDWAGQIAERAKELALEETFYIQPEGPGLRQPHIDVAAQPNVLLGKLTSGVKSTIRLEVNQLTNASLVGQVNNELIVIHSQADGRLLLVDQHAADERIRYERLQDDLMETRFWNDLVSVKCNTADRMRTNGSADLDAAEHHTSPLLKITRRECDLLRKHSDFLKSWAFQWKHVGTFEVLVTHVPQAFGIKLSPHAILEVLQDAQHQDTDGVPSPMKRLLASRACRGAIMFGQSLTTDQCQRLVNDLAHCRLPFQCAHGRPSVIPSTIQLF